MIENPKQYLAPLSGGTSASQSGTTSQTWRTMQAQGLNGRSDATTRLAVRLNELLTSGDGANRWARHLPIQITPDDRALVESLVGSAGPVTKVRLIQLLNNSLITVPEAPLMWPCRPDFPDEASPDQVNVPTARTDRPLLAAELTVAAVRAAQSAAQTTAPEFALLLVLANLLAYSE